MMSHIDLKTLLWSQVSQKKKKEVRTWKIEEKFPPSIFLCGTTTICSPLLSKIKIKKRKTRFLKKHYYIIWQNIFNFFLVFLNCISPLRTKKRKKESCTPKKIRNFGFSFEKNLFGFFFAKFDRLPNLTTSLPFLSLCMYRSQKKIFKGIWRVKSETQWFVLKSFFYYF